MGRFYKDHEYLAVMLQPDTVEYMKQKHKDKTRIQMVNDILFDELVKTKGRLTAKSSDFRAIKGKKSYTLQIESAPRENQDKSIFEMLTEMSDEQNIIPNQLVTLIIENVKK